MSELFKGDPLAPWAWYLLEQILLTPHNEDILSSNTSSVSNYDKQETVFSDRDAIQMLPPSVWWSGLSGRGHNYGNHRWTWRRCLQICVVLKIKKVGVFKHYYVDSTLIGQIKLTTSTQDWFKFCKFQLNFTDCNYCYHISVDYSH